MGAPRTSGSMIAGRYRIEAQIGSGGHGAVYRAGDTGIGRPVALKLLHDGAPGAAGLEGRFEQEARLARELQHPNTVRLVDFGRTDDGELYIAYELLDGVAMDQALQHGPMDPARVAHIGAQLLKSLMEAHARGVVHRDVKPANVFLCRYAGEQDFVKVLDFGIAKSVEVGSQLTQTGFVVGTPSYMAPEQVRGDPVCPATDLYAVGLLLAEALAGRVIVLGNTDAVTAAAQLSADPVVLPTVVLQSPLAPIIHRATQKPLDRRYQTAEQMLVDLQAVQLAPSTAIGAPQPQSFSLAPTGQLARGHVEPALPPSPTGMPAPIPRPLERAKSGSGGVLAGMLALVALSVMLIVVGVVYVMAQSRVGSGSAGEENDSSAEDPGKNKKKNKKKKSKGASGAEGDESAEDTEKGDDNDKGDDTEKGDEPKKDGDKNDNADDDEKKKEPADIPPRPSSSPLPAPPPAPTAEPRPSGKTGTLVGIAIGGACAFSVDGAPQGTKTSVRLKVAVGPHTVTCAPPGKPTLTQQVAVTEDKAGVASFKLN